MPKKDRLRHYRRYLRHLAVTHLLLIPLAVLVASTAPHRGDYPFACEALLWHAVSCAIVVVVGRLLLAILELFHCGRRLRIRGELYFKLLSIWPVATFMTMAFLKFVGAA